MNKKPSVIASTVCKYLVLATKLSLQAHWRERESNSASRSSNDYDVTVSLSTEAL